jgi:hypothetical protein
VKGLELRSDGTYVVAPPSIHYTGRQYEWKNISSGRFMDELPECLIDFATHGEKIFENAASSKLRRGAKDSQSSMIARLDTYSPPPWSEAEEARVAAALHFVPADDRETWLRAGMALHWTTWGRPHDLG